MVTVKNGLLIPFLYGPFSIATCGGNAGKLLKSAETSHSPSLATRQKSPAWQVSLQGYPTVPLGGRHGLTVELHPMGFPWKNPPQSIGKPWEKPYGKNMEKP